MGSPETGDWPPPEDMATRPQRQKHLSLPVVRRPRKASPGDRDVQSSNQSEQSPNSSDKGGTGSQHSGDSRPARKRASKPKVRTGCISCKKRHVKCDEGKPSCAECERLGLMCEGYATPKIKKPAPRTERLLLPKPELIASTASSSQTTTAAAPQSVSSHATLSPMPSFGFELNDEDGWYFTLFRDQVAHELSPYYQSNFWTRTSLRDSMVNKCIHHSVLSIGAYARALMDLRNEYSWRGNVSRTWWPPSVLNRHHQAALVHHAKALSHLRSDIDMYGIDSRVAMAATLLFIVFENMQGNYHSSGNLIRSGIKVVTNLRRTYGESKSTLRRRQWHRQLTVPRNDEVEEMTDMFARHSITSAYIPFAHGKFAYHLLLTEDEDDGDVYSEDEDDDSGLVDPHPFAVLQTLEQARQIWDYLLPLLANFQSKAIWHNLNPDYDFDKAAALREQTTYLAQLHSFGVGLDSLILSPADSPGLELLKLHRIVAVVFVSCCLDPTEMLYDDFLPQFQDVVRRSRAFLDFKQLEMPTNVGFTNEVGVLLLLAFVCTKCRTARVRLEAVQLMKQLDWREGIWDSTSLANAVGGILKLEGQLVLADNQEEQSHSTDIPLIPPAEARYTWSNIFWDFEKQEINVEFIKVLPNCFNTFEKINHIINI
ncbi:hypothetical protein F4779DRAFT_610062 [Xylariaceae sp. FL0662B]|nr:hypothetical protein F4779DRAFT_610062 [Xylariaceae sp. FL0662B]